MLCSISRKARFDSLLYPMLETSDDRDIKRWRLFGEGSLAGQPLRMGSATAMTDCAILRIDKQAMMDALHREHKLSDVFVAYLLSRNIGTKKIWLIS